MTSKINTHKTCQHLLLIVLTVLMCNSAIAQTYYYERVATVSNNVKRTASGDGHFITFTSNACYDSDVEGYSENFGVLKYQGVTSKNYLRYQGESYFGQADYYFTADRSRLNIYKSNGEILVYAKKTAPKGVRKSSRKPKETETIVISPTHTDITPTTTTTTTTSTTPTKPKKESRYGYYDCPVCHGTGNCPTCGGNGFWHNHYEGGKPHLCTQCPNSSGRCPRCDGKGKVYGIIR